MRAPKVDGGATWNPPHTYTCASRWPQAYTPISGRTQQELDTLIVRTLLRVLGKFKV